MQHELNKSVKVFSQLYVGFRTKKVGDLAFATPYEDNAAGRKRQETVNNWACGWDKKNPITKIVDNVPREGFKITDDVKRVYWGGGNVVFRVYDPYDFELEIQSQNLMALIQTCGISAGGLIPGKCIWGRDGGQNVLLHEDSEEYKNAILAAETIKKPKILTSRLIGSKYKLLDGSSAIYLGKMWVYTHDYSESQRWASIGRIDRIINHDPEQFDAVQMNGEDGGTIKFYKKAPLVELLQKKSELSAEKINKLVWNARDWCYATSRSDTICYASVEKAKQLEYDLFHISENEFKERKGRIREYDFRYAGLCGWSTRSFVVRHDGKLFTNPAEIHSRITNDGSRHPRIVLGAATINQSVYSALSIRDRWAGYGNHWPGQMTGNISRITEVFCLPKFETAEQAHQFLQQKYDNADLLNVRVIDRGA